ncbi:ribosome recycling factor, partial [Candidatus Uhrbacteria bacterium]|nr:ribosome recycling factor [Candidatus Uhrbacteria bacterium]MBD3283927.1 ribosome recycling factor [Candidatus Uhrbacteria bacterium]
AKTIQMEPWDKTLIGAIEKALVAANLGMQPTTAGNVIRLNIPTMTEENRKAVVKQVHEKAEHARISIRNIREQVRDAIAKAEKDKEIAEDEKFRLQEELDKQVKQWNEKIEAMADAKEKEIMTI